MFAFGIAPSAMNGSAASGLSLIRAKPSASSIASSGHWKTIDASFFICSREHVGRALDRAEAGDRELARVRAGEAGVRVPVAVVAGPHVHDVDVAAEDVGDDLRRRRLVPLSLRRRAERDDDLAEDVELDRRDLVVAGELQVGVDQLRLAEVVRAGVERRADPEAEQLAARRGLRPPLLDRVVADQLERHVERPRVVAGVVDAAVRRLVRHVLGLDVVALAQLDRVEAELVRDDVDRRAR